MKRKVYLFFTTLFAVVIGSVTTVQAQSYTCQGHYYGCETSTYGGRYSAINSLEILDGNGNSLMTKDADGCNSPNVAYNAPSGHYNVMTGTPDFVLIAGNTYTVKVDLSHVQNTTQTSCFIGFLDLDGDGNYQNVAGEHISENWNHSGLQTGRNGAAGQIHTFKFTIPCAGVVSGSSRIRFRSEYYTYLNNAPNEHSTKEQYGETEEYFVKLKYPSDITSEFYMVDTAYTNTKVVAYNQSNGTSWEWDEGNNGIDQYGGETYNNMPTSTIGTKFMKQIAHNCAGSDSSYQSLEVINPPTFVDADFVSDVNEALIYSEVTFSDLSDYGPTSWNWKLYDSSQATPVTYDNGDMNPGSPQDNPTFLFYDPGLYTVCLQGRNVFGWGPWKCKKDYVQINNFKEFDVTSAWGQAITEQRGKLYDVGGEFGDYYNNSSLFTNFLQVVPCNAKSIDLTFTKFQMGDDNDRVYVFDGPDLTGKPLHPAGGFKQSEWGSKTPFTLKAKSGAFFIYYESDGSGTDEGFVALWDSELGDSIAPTASFTLPSVMYNSVPVTPKNTSTNVQGLTNFRWSWNSTIESDGPIKEPEFVITTDNSYNVCLEVSNCLGKDTFCQQVSVVTPNSPTNTDFTANKLRPVIGEEVSMTVTNDKANRFEWSFIPNTVSYLNGTNANSMEPQVSFNGTGCYLVSLTAWNAINPKISSRTEVKSDYICVLSYCKPTVISATTDISINNFKLNNGTENLIDNTSDYEPSGYQDFSADINMPVFFGQSYTLTVSRLTNSDPWNSKIWIDWNVDGDFDDAGELIHTEAMSYDKSYTAKLNIPDINNAFPGRSRIRIGSAEGTGTLNSCGPNAIGEYEDYGIIFTKDTDIPVITLKGDATVVVEKSNSPSVQNYIEPGFTAIDYSDGDITSKVIVETDLEHNVPGYYTMTYSVCDNSGNCAVVKTRNIKVVVDLTPPVITLTNPVLNLNVNDKRACLTNKVTRSFDYALIGATSLDANDGDVTELMLYDKDAVNIDMVGVYTVEFVSHDIQGNTSKATATVNVTDTKNPNIIESGSEEIQIGTQWVDQTVVCDNYDNQAALRAVPGPNGMPNTNKYGEYPVTYDATDGSGNDATTVTRTYRVGDFIAPVINLGTADTIYHDVDVPYTSVPVSVTDVPFTGSNIAAIQSGDIVNEKVLGTYKEIFTATDGAGNVSVRTRFIKVVDRVAPKISALDIKEQVGHEWWHMEGVEVFDNYDNEADLRKNIEIIEQNINFWEAGNYTISYQVTDLSGNKSSVLVRNVEIGYENAKTIGVDDLAYSKLISIYPVPANKNITVTLKGDLSDVSAVIVNQLGQEVKVVKTVTNGSTISISDLANGAYFIKFTTGSKVTMKKFIKE